MNKDRLPIKAIRSYYGNQKFYSISIIDDGVESFSYRASSWNYALRLSKYYSSLYSNCSSCFILVKPVY